VTSFDAHVNASSLALDSKYNPDRWLKIMERVIDIPMAPNNIIDSEVVLCNDHLKKLGEG
jgi:hypothetical protein